VAFRLYRSNRVEKLAEALCGVASTPLKSPFSRECVVVQGPGMERWLSAFLAERLSVWANPWFPFPRTIVELLLEAVLGPVEEQASGLEQGALAFRIAHVLPNLREQPALASLSEYLRNDVGHERLLSVSSDLAYSLDQCLVYRPELVLSWEAGEGEDLHAVLWRALRERAPFVHLAQRIRAFHDALRAGASFSSKSELPERICLFGISALPPAFLSVFARAAQHLDVHLFLLSPSQEYWGDFDKKLARGQDLHALLATLGKVGRDFVEQLEELEYAESGDDLFHHPEPDTILHGLCGDLATLTARGRLSDALPPLNARPSDDSLSVHVCHSEMRELEVLRDQLRARLERDPTLEPHDIVVLTPDIERYAARVHAVFAASGEEDPSFIPYHVADRRTSQLSPLSDALLKLLELARSRLGLSEVLDLLHRTPVRTRFALTEDELDHAEDYLSDAGARWAIDAAHRASFGQPELSEHTLSFGLSRLLLGYALPDGEQRSFSDLLPHSEVEGHEALALGKVAHFLRALFETVSSLSGTKTFGAWVELLARSMPRLLCTEGEHAAEYLLLSKLTSELASDAESGGFLGEVSLATFTRELTKRLDQRRSQAGFLSGGITFCEHLPMRAIPFRVVCLIGMDDDAFPRRALPSPFDLLAQKPRTGDRTLRDDDRQIFLECLLSARDALFISYVGRSPKDDSPRPCSVLVERLLAVVDKHFVLSSDGKGLHLGLEGSVAESITHVHALHRFDPRYFRDPRHKAFFSYEETAREAARALLTPEHRISPFVSGPLPVLEPGARDLSLESVVRFFRSPQRAFLEERLSVYLPRDQQGVPDREPTTLEGLERFRVADDLFRELAPLLREEQRRIMRQSARLPPGTLGEVMLKRIELDVAAVQNAVPESEDEHELSFQFELDELRIFGRLEGVSANRRVERILSAARAKHYVSAWLRHLALCIAHDPASETLLVSRDAKKGAQVVTFRPVANAREELRAWVDARALGLVMPLPLFAQPAFECAKSLRQGKSESEAASVLERALTRQSPIGKPEAEDPFLRQIWSPRELERASELTARDARGHSATGFTLARTLFLPLLAHMSEGSEA
jgi:exodeoxyribonuclease V gamma subunit